MTQFRLTLLIAVTADWLLAILVPLGLAQDESCLRRTVSVTAADRNWAPIRDLKPGDFLAEYRGKPVKILSVVPDNLPHRIVIVLDASGSFGAGAVPGTWQLACSMASQLAESRMPRTDFALLIFNDKVQEQIDFSQGPQAVAHRLRQIEADPDYHKTKVRGRTALLDTIIVGLGLLQKPTSGDALYAITDGEDNASRTTLKDVRRRLVASGSRLFTSILVTSTHGYRRRPPEELGAEETKEITHATGGAIFGPVMQTTSGPQFAEGDFDQKFTVSDGLGGLYQTILSGYRVEIELPSDVDRWREWKLELSKERQQFKHAQLGYTRDLAPCTEPRK